MPGYTVTVLGRELSFQAEVTEDRLQRVIELVERRYAQLEPQGRSIGKERLLIYVALSLADECLQNADEMERIDRRILQLIQSIDTAMHQTLGSA